MYRVRIDQTKNWYFLSDLDNMIDNIWNVDGHFFVFMVGCFYLF